MAIAGIQGSSGDGYQVPYRGAVDSHKRGLQQYAVPSVEPQTMHGRPLGRSRLFNLVLHAPQIHWNGFEFFHPPYRTIRERLSRIVLDNFQLWPRHPYKIQYDMASMHEHHSKGLFWFIAMTMVQCFFMS